MNLRQLDLNLLLVFDTVYATRSNTKAAEKLGLTQSAVSNALRRLRQHLDDPLFERQGGDFVPTAEADRLAPIIRQALRSLEQSISNAGDFDPVASNRAFSLLMPDSIELIAVPPLIKQFRENGYGMRLETAPLFGTNAREALLTKRFDFVFLPNPMQENAIHSAYLFDEDPCMICRADHPEFAERDTFQLEDMSRVGLVNLPEEVRRVTHMEHEIRAKNIARNVVCTVSRLWSIPAIVSRTDLFAAIPRTMAESLAPEYGFKIFDFPLERPTHHWHMMWHEDLEADPAHSWLRRELVKLFQAL
ncbi:MAG: LysR family transcriptional regulator [Rhodobiaceae bacterium]|nr:LysR family transcriptional regulator [Rhodobiaceae bacterium]MCC0011919.1 LysR family transcriptional regulator [Rhodobiaceae bacterium]MCC0018569.1 LysR family transcriptional regulator [Rhodobiaceae bacterium]MCC0050426.1 LysR family transcriptional regulator [Rhodobiaceae bacterium]MCC0061165.1 LysR family transcriptional regulator [Rhodobiaceae bacterium]